MGRVRCSQKVSANNIVRPRLTWRSCSLWQWLSGMKLSTGSLLCPRSCAVQTASTGAWINMLTFYVIPNGPQRSSVLFQGFFSEAAIAQIPLPVRIMQQWQPKWCAPQSLAPSHFRAGGLMQPNACCKAKQSARLFISAHLRGVSPS